MFCGSAHTFLLYFRTAAAVLSFLSLSLFSFLFYQTNCRYYHHEAGSLFSYKYSFAYFISLTIFSLTNAISSCHFRYRTLAKSKKRFSFRSCFFLVHEYKRRSRKTRINANEKVVFAFAFDTIVDSLKPHNDLRACDIKHIVNVGYRWGKTEQTNGASKC